MIKPLLKACLLTAALLLRLAGDSSAYPGDGIQLGKTTLTPYAEGTATYDSNVSLSEEPVADRVLAAKLGIRAARSWQAASVSGEIWGQALRYAEHTTRDAELLGESLRVGVLLFDRLNLSVSQQYTTSTEEKDFLTGLLGTIREFGGSISLGQPLTDRTTAVFSYERSQAAYEIKELYNWHRDSGALRLDHKMTDKTTAFLSSRVSLQSSQGSGDATIYGEYAGVRTELTDKTSAACSLGWEYQDAETVISIPSTEGSLTWAATETTSVGLNWGVSIRPAIEYKDNYVVCGVGQLRVGIELTDTVRMDLGAAYHQNRYWNDVTTSRGDTGKLVENIPQATLGLAYTVPMSFLTVFAQAEYTDKTTSLDIEEYERYRITLGVRLQY